MGSIAATGGPRRRWAMEPCGEGFKGVIFAPEVKLLTNVPSVTTYPGCGIRLAWNTSSTLIVNGGGDVAAVILGAGGGDQRPC